LLSFLNKSGRLLPAQMEEDRVAIRTLYQNRGFADAEVTDVQTVPLEGNGVELNITIVEGVQYRVNTVRLEGVNIVPSDEIKLRLKMVDGSLFTPKGMGDDLKILRDFYGSPGVFDMLPVPHMVSRGRGGGGG